MKITKTQIPNLKSQLKLWADNNQHRFNKLSPQFKNWIETELLDIDKRIDDQDYFFAVQSKIKHLVMRLRQFENGEIISVERRADGNSSFTINRG